MSKKDVFGDSTLDEKEATDFASMFEQSLALTGKRLQVGDRLRGEILSIGKESSYIATGTPNDGLIPTTELKDEKGELKYKAGDFVDVVVVKFRDGELRVALKNATNSSSDVENLEDAFDMELPLEGRVLESVNGGFRVQIQGVKTFCPLSQMDFRVVDPASYVGKKYDFLITQYENGGRNIVVSRRKLLDLQKAEKEGEFLNQHQVGDLVEGTVSRLEKFGAFVTLESGVEGLIHVSELSWGRVHDPRDVISEGTPVRVKILKLEEIDNRLKISLSLKQGGGESDPWLSVLQKFPVGTVAQGTVEKKENFGLFVTLAPGVTGLLPKSKWRDSVEGSQFENKKRGDTLAVRVDHVDFEAKRISLGLPTEAEDLSWKEFSGKEGKGFGSAFANLGSLLNAGDKPTAKNKGK